MNDDIIWDAVLERYYEYFSNEIVSSVPTIEDAIHINPTEKLTEALHLAQEHHVKHVKDTRLKENGLDAYKALSWLSSEMSKQCESTPVFDCAIWAGIRALNNNLLHETNYPNNGLPERTLNLINAMIKNELTGISQHGIERNGLFLSFHSALETLKNCK